MDRLQPWLLLRDPSLVEPSAPWCRRLGNLELGILLLAQPWVAGEGLRRADLERSLARFDREMPVGPVYFQRVRRSVADLEAGGALEGTGSGRSRRFVATPEGFAALVLNLMVVEEDPTLDAREFELKRSLIALASVISERVAELPSEVAVDPECERFFRRVEEVTVLGHPVASEELVARAFDVRRLIAEQRRRVEELRAGAEERLRRVTEEADLARGVDLGHLVGPAGRAGAGEPKVLSDDPAVLEAIRVLATRTVPALSARAAVVRYDSFLEYLDELATLYSRELRVADLAVFRRRAEARRG